MKFSILRTLKLFECIYSSVAKEKLETKLNSELTNIDNLTRKFILHDKIYSYDTELSLDSDKELTLENLLQSSQYKFKKILYCGSQRIFLAKKNFGATECFFIQMRTSNVEEVEGFVLMIEKTSKDYYVNIFPVSFGKCDFKKLSENKNFQYEHQRPAVDFQIHIKDFIKFPRAKIHFKTNLALLTKIECLSVICETTVETIEDANSEFFINQEKKSLICPKKDQLSIRNPESELVFNEHYGIIDFVFKSKSRNPKRFKILKKIFENQQLYNLFCSENFDASQFNFVSIKNDFMPIFKEFLNPITKFEFDPTSEEIQIFLSKSKTEDFSIKLSKMSTKNFKKMNLSKSTNNSKDQFSLGIHNTLKSIISKDSSNRILIKFSTKLIKDFIETVNLFCFFLDSWLLNNNSIDKYAILLYEFLNSLQQLLQNKYFNFSDQIDKKKRLLSKNSKIFAFRFELEDLIESIENEKNSFERAAKIFKYEKFVKEGKMELKRRIFELMFSQETDFETKQEKILFTCNIKHYFLLDRKIDVLLKCIRLNLHVFNV